MLGKLLNVGKLNPFRHHVKEKLPCTVSGSGSALKLAHPGGRGRVECYYKAISLMGRYPSFLLATPDVFKQPWDAIMRPDQLLFPVPKFLVVPQRTVRTLRHRVQKPSARFNSFASDVSSTGSACGSTMIKMKTRTQKHLNFFCNRLKEEKEGGVEDQKSEHCDQSLDFLTSINTNMKGTRSKKVVQRASWHPALESISEMCLV